MTSGGNNFNDFSENQLTKFRAVQTAKANWDQIFQPAGSCLRSRSVTITLIEKTLGYRNSQVQGEPNKQTSVSGDIKLCCLITIKRGNNIYLFITKYSLLRLH